MSVAIPIPMDPQILELKSQLDEVTQLLLSNPSDESLRALHADITIALTAAFAAAARTSTAATTTATATATASTAAAAPSLVASAAVTGTDAASTQRAVIPNTFVSASTIPIASAAGGVVPPPLPSIAQIGGAVPPPLPLFAAVAAAAGGAGAGGAGSRKWQVKERCLAQWTDEKYYSARIDSISELLTYRVTYLDYGNSAELTESQLLPYLHAPAGLLKPGVLVRAIWPEDGLFYDAKIEGVGSARGNFFVKFTKYKKTQIEVRVDDIVIRRTPPNAFNEGKDGSAADAVAATAFAPTATASAQQFGMTGGLTEAEVKELLALSTAPDYAAYTAAAATTSSLYPEKKKSIAVDVNEKVVIPENLQILPTDSEQVKALKQKKIKRLKSKHRHAVLEAVGEIKQNSWQKFTQKAARVSGGVTTSAGASAAAGGGGGGGAGSGSAAVAKPSGAAEKKLAKSQSMIDSLRVLGHKRKSIFATSDAVDGRVGVTGSGRSMTEYKEVGRAKFVRSEPTAAGAGSGGGATTVAAAGYDD